MQVLEVQGSHYNDKRPSKTLEKLIDSCVSDFSKLNKSVNRVLEQGRKEGFSDIETGNLIRRKLIVAGFSDRTARRYLPASAKHMEKSRTRKVFKPADVDNLSANTNTSRATSGSNPNPNTNTNSAVILSANTSTNRNRKSSASLNLSFQGRVVRMGPRLIITVPTSKHSDAIKFLSKELDISITTTK
jgi:hypothetical protein